MSAIGPYVLCLSDGCEFMGQVGVDDMHCPVCHEELFTPDDDPLMNLILYGSDS